MRCDELEPLSIDFFEERLPAGRRRELERHLDDCPACRHEIAALGELWARLGEIEEEEPGPAVRRRFEAMLAAYRQGEEEAPRPSLAARLEGWLAAWWPRRPALQAAAAGAALLLGVVLGAQLAPALGSGRELRDLRSEVHSLTRLVTVSLLEQPSASDRLRGVSFSRRAERADAEVIAALLETLRGDPSANVRLAAVDALTRFAERGDVGEELEHHLAEEPSPLVQIALVDALLEADGEAARRAVRRLLAEPSLDETVRRHVEARLGQTA